MGSLTSSLILQLKDDGLQAKAKADAEALKRLGMSADSLKKLGTANPKIADLTKRFDGLQARAGKIDEFKRAGQGLKDMSAGLRAARAQVALTANEVVKRKASLDWLNGVRARDPKRYARWKADGRLAQFQAAAKQAKATAAKAQRAMPGAEAAYGNQRAIYRSLRTELVGADGALNKLAGAHGNLRARVEATSEALRKEIALIEQAGAKARFIGNGAPRGSREGNARAGRAIAQGMGISGRATLGDRESSARLIAGMGAGARGRRAAQAQAEQDAATKAAERAEERANARKALLGMGGIALGHKVHNATDATLETYRDFDKYRRQTQAFGNFDDAEMEKIVGMAMHGGANTRYNDIQWLQGAKALGGRGVKSGAVMGILPEAANYGQAMSTDLPEAVAGLEGSLFAFQRDLSTPEKAAAAARRTADLQVGAAKAFGLTHEDLKGGYEYGALGAETTGLGEEKLLAFLGLGKKLNIEGAAQGNAFRAMTAKYLSPTQKGREALAGVGIKYGDFQKMPDRLNVGNFENVIGQQYGVKLNDKARGKLDKAFSDKNVFTNPSAFAAAVKDAVAGQVGVRNAQDAKKIAGSAERFRQNNVEKVDVNGLMDALMEKIKGGNLALANAIFGEKQGNRIMAALRDGDLWNQSLAKVQLTPDGKAADVAEKINAGYDGAMKRFEGSIKNLESRMGQSWDNDGKGGFLTELANKSAAATQSLAELPRPVLQVASALGYIGGKAATAAGTIALVGAAFSLKGSAGALTAAAARLGIGGAATAATTAGSAAAAGGATAAGITAGGLATVGLIGSGAALGGYADMQVTNGADELDANRKAWEDAQASIARSKANDASAGSLGYVTPRGKRPLSMPPGVDAGGGVRTSLKFERTGTLDAFFNGKTAAHDVDLPSFGKAAAYGTPGAAPGSDAAAKPKADLGKAKAQADELQAALRGIGSEAISPKVDASQIDGVKPKADAAKHAIDAIGSATAKPTIDTSSLSAAEAHADRLLSKLQALPGAVNSAVAAGGRLSSNVILGRSRMGSSPSFSDGVTPGYGPP